MRKISAILLLCVMLFSGCTQMHNNDLQSADNVPDEITIESEKSNEQTAQRTNYRFETQELHARREGNQIYGVIYIPQNTGEKMPAAHDTEATVCGQSKHFSHGNKYGRRSVGHDCRIT